MNFIAKYIQKDSPNLAFKKGEMFDVIIVDSPYGLREINRS